MASINRVDRAHDVDAPALILQEDASQRRHINMTPNDSQAETSYKAHEDTEKLHGGGGAAVHKEEELGLDTETHAVASKRFLCWSLSKTKWIGAIVGSVLTVLLVVLLIVFLAVVPAIFQKYVDKVHMSVNYMDILTLSPNASRNEIDVALSLRVAYSASMSASMDDAVATLYYDKKPFGAITLPTHKFQKGADDFELVIRNVAEITDAAVFRRLSKALVTDDSITIDTHAAIKVRAMGLSYGGLELDRSFAIKAFANFADPKPRVNNITLLECTATAYTLRINTTLDNVSQAGIRGIGALNLSVYHEQNYLGQAVSTDVSVGLPRGPTDMVLELTIVNSAKTMAAMLGMVSGLLGSGVQFFIRGDHPGAVQAPLLDEAFAALNISLLYTDGLSRVTLNPKCNLLSLLSGGR